MVTKQLSDTNVASRLYTQDELGLDTTSAPNAESSVQTTKMKAGCNGQVFVWGKSSGAVVIKVAVAATDVLNFAAGGTLTLTVNTNAGNMIEINGDTKKYWGLKVDDASLLTDLLVFEMCQLADGESISLVQAGFNAKNVAGTGDFASAFI